LLGLPLEHRLHLRGTADTARAVAIGSAREDGIEPLTQGLLELGAVIAARMGDGDLAEDGFPDPLNRFVAEDAGVHQFGAELQQSNGRGLRAQPNELERAMQLARAFGLIMIHQTFSGTGLGALLPAPAE